MSMATITNTHKSNDAQVLKQLKSLRDQFHKTRFGLPENDDRDDDPSTATAIEQLFDIIHDGCHCATVNSHKDCESEISSIVDHVNKYNDEIDLILLQSYSIIKNIFDNICVSTNGNKYCCLNEVAILLKYSFRNIVLCYIFAIESQIDEYYSFDEISDDIYQQSIVNRIIILKLLNQWYEYKCQSKFFDKYFQSYKDKRSQNNVQFFNERIESYHSYLLFSFGWIWDIFYSMFNTVDISFNLALFSNFNKKLRFNYDCIKTLEIFNQIIFDFRKITKIFLMNKRYTKSSQTQSFLWIDIIQLDPNVYNYFLFENTLLCNLLRYKCDDNINGIHKQNAPKKDKEEEKKQEQLQANGVNQMLQVIQSLEQKILVVKHDYFMFVNGNSILNIDKNDKKKNNNNKNRWINKYPTIFNIWQCMLNSSNCNYMCLLIFLTHIWHCISHTTNNHTQTHAQEEKRQSQCNSQHLNTAKTRKKRDENSNNTNKKIRTNGETNKNVKNQRSHRDAKAEYKEEKEWDNLYDFRIFTSTNNNTNFVQPIDDSSNDILIFKTNSAKIYRQQTKPKQIWLARGFGTLSILYNKQRKILTLKFLDKEYNKIRLHQTFYPYFNYNMISKQNSNTNTNTNGLNSITWFNTDYSTSPTPVTGIWKLTIQSEQTHGTQDSETSRKRDPNKPKSDKIEQMKFLNIIKDFYFGFGLPQWIEHAIKLKYGSINTKPIDYIWENKNAQQVIKKQQRIFKQKQEEVKSHLVEAKVNNYQRHLKQIYLLMMDDLLKQMKQAHDDEAKQKQKEKGKEQKKKKSLSDISSCQAYHCGDSLSYNVKLLIKYLFNYIDNEYQRVKHCREKRELMRKFSCTTAKRLISMNRQFNNILSTLETNWNYFNKYKLFMQNYENGIENFFLFELSVNFNDRKLGDIIFKQLTHDLSGCIKVCFNCNLCKYIQKKRKLRLQAQTQAKAKANAKSKANVKPSTSVQTQGQHVKNKCDNNNMKKKKKRNKKKQKRKNKNKNKTTNVNQEFFKSLMKMSSLFSGDMSEATDIAIAAIGLTSPSPSVSRDKNMTSGGKQKKQAGKKTTKNSTDTAQQESQQQQQKQHRKQQKHLGSKSNKLIFCLNGNCKLQIELCYWWSLLQTELGGNINSARCQIALTALNEQIDRLKARIPDKWRRLDNDSINSKRRINLNKNNSNNINIIDSINKTMDRNNWNDCWFIDSNWFSITRSHHFHFISVSIPSYSNCFLQLIFCANLGRFFNANCQHKYNPQWLQQLIRHWILPYLILKIKLVVKAKMYDEALNEINFILKYIDSSNQFALQWKPNVIYCMQSCNYNGNHLTRSTPSGSNSNQKWSISPQCFKMAFTESTKATTNSKDSATNTNICTNIDDGTNLLSQKVNSNDPFCFPIGASMTTTPESNVLALFGGKNKNTNQLTNDLWIVDVHQRKSTLLSNGNGITPRLNHSAHLISNRKLYIIGGQFANYNLYQRYHDITLRNQLSSVKLNRNNGCDDRLTCSFDFYTKKWHIPQNVFLLHKRDGNGNVQLGNYVNTTDINHTKDYGYSNFLNLLFLDVHCSVQLNNKEIYVFTTSSWYNFVISIENRTNNSSAILKWTQLPKIFKHGDSSFKNKNEFIISMNALYSVELQQIILIETSNYLDTRIIMLDPHYGKGNMIAMKSIGENLHHCNNFVRGVRKLRQTPWMNDIEPAFCPSRGKSVATARRDAYVNTSDGETKDSENEEYQLQQESDSDGGNINYDICDEENELDNDSWNDYSSFNDYSTKFKQLCPKFDTILFDTRYFMINKNYTNVRRKSKRANNAERNFNKITDIRNSKIDKQYDYDCEKIFMSYQDYNYILKKLDKTSEYCKRQDGYDIMDYHNEPTRVSILFHVKWTQKYAKHGNEEDDYQYQRKSDFFMLNLLFFKPNKAIKYTQKLGPRSIWCCGCGDSAQAGFSSEAQWWSIDFTPKCLQQERFPNAIRNVVDTDDDNYSNYIGGENGFMLLNNNYLILLDENNFRFMGLKQNWMYYILNFGRMYHFQTLMDVMHQSYMPFIDSIAPSHLLTRTLTNFHQGSNDLLTNNCITNNVIAQKVNENDKNDKNDNNRNRNELIGYKVVTNRVETMIVRNDHISSYIDSIGDDWFEDEYYWLEDTQLLDDDRGNFKASLYHLINYDSSISRLVECSYCHCVELNPIYFKRCNKCNICVYCSSLCQQLHWDQSHSKYCAQIDRFKFNKNIDNVRLRQLLIRNGSRFGYKVRRNDICGINGLFINEKKQNQNETGMRLITNFLHSQEKEMKIKEIENNQSEASVQEKIDKLFQQIERSFLLSQKTNGKKKKKKKITRNKNKNKNNTKNKNSAKMDSNKKKQKKKKRRRNKKKRKKDNTSVEVAIAASQSETESECQIDDIEYDIEYDSDSQIEGKGDKDVENDNNDNIDDDIFQIEMLNLPIMTKESDIANIFNIDANDIQLIDNGDNVKCILNVGDIQSIMQISIYHKKYKYRLSKNCIIKHLFVSHRTIVGLKQKYLINLENKQQDFDAIFMLFKLCGVLTRETMTLVDN